MWHFYIITSCFTIKFFHEFFVLGRIHVFLPKSILSIFHEFYLRYFDFFISGFFCFRLIVRTILFSPTTLTMPKLRKCAEIAWTHTMQASKQNICNIRRNREHVRKARDVQVYAREHIIRTRTLLYGSTEITCLILNADQFREANDLRTKSHLYVSGQKNYNKAKYSYIQRTLI